MTFSYSGYFLGLGEIDCKYLGPTFIFGISNFYILNYCLGGIFSIYKRVETLAAAVIVWTGLETNFILSTFAYNYGFKSVMWGFFFYYFLIYSYFFS